MPSSFQQLPFRRVHAAGLYITNAPLLHLAQYLISDFPPSRPLLGAAAHVTAINALGQPGFSSAMKRSSFVYADGYSALLLAKASGGSRCERLATTDLGPMLVSKLHRHLGREVRLAIVGGDPGIAIAAGCSDILRSAGAHLVLAEDGYHSSWANVLARLRDARPDLLLIGMGMPLELKWVDTHRDSLPPCIVLTCGGWLRLLAGVERRSPRWLQSLRLEWLYRLLTDPRRTWRRYAVGVSHLPRLLLIAWLRRG